MRYFILTVGCVLLAGLLVPTPATAVTFGPDSYFDPDWTPQWFQDCRGYKQWARWEFNEDQTPRIPTNDGYNWSFGDPGDENTTPLDTANTRDDPRVFLTGNATWMNQAQNRQGLIGSASSPDFYDLHIWMDNDPAALIKQVWFQMDFWVASVLPATVADGLTLDHPTVTGLQPMEVDVGNPDASGWRTLTAYWEIPQLEWERVDFVFQGPEPIYIDRVQMVTQCTPEPTTVIATMLALAGIGRYTRKRIGRAAR